MHVAIDATPLTLSSGGLARYTQELTRALGEEFPDDRFTLMSDQPFDWTPSENVDVIAGPATGVAKRWWLAGIPLAMHQTGASLFHGTNFAVPFIPFAPGVMTIHDLSPWMNASWHSDASRVRHRTPWMLRLGLAAMVITVSEAVRKQAVDFFGLHPSRVIAIPLAAARHFTRDDSRPGNYFLFVGTLEPRKNLPVLIEAWRHVYAITGVELWLAGRTRVDCPALPELPGLRRLGEVEEKDLPGLYRGTLAFVYPSLYEGFGLPVLEAMQCGANVITSRDAAIAEVCGDAALRIDAHDVRGWTEAMLACAAGHIDLRDAASKRARLFSWQSTARRTREVYVEARQRER